MIRKAGGVGLEKTSTGRIWLVRRGGSGASRYLVQIQDEVWDDWNKNPEAPLRVGHDSSSGKCYWQFGEHFWVTDEPDLTERDVVALVNEQENRKRLRLQRAHSLQAMADQLDERGRRQKIPGDVKARVWERDGGQCSACASTRDLEFDHIIPLKLGGSNTERNLQLLCAECNRRKGATLAGEDTVRREPDNGRHAEPGDAAKVVVQCPTCFASNRTTLPLGLKLRCGKCRAEFYPAA
jgi:5-methylcytosine-specific restriction endonuclease McrA